MPHTRRSDGPSDLSRLIGQRSGNTRADAELGAVKAQLRSYAAADATQTAALKEIVKRRLDIPQSVDIRLSYDEQTGSAAFGSNDVVVNGHCVLPDGTTERFQGYLDDGTVTWMAGGRERVMAAAAQIEEF